MRNLDQFRKFRYHHDLYDNSDPLGGAFLVPSESSRRDTLRIIASSGEGWDHISVSVQNRIPTWTEMEQVANMFFMSSEYAFQLHVPTLDHINCHPYTLHWWRSHTHPIPVPPKEMV